MKFREFLNEDSEMAYAIGDAAGEELAKASLNMVFDMFETAIKAGEFSKSEYAEKLQGLINIFNGEKDIDNSFRKKLVNKVKALGKKYGVDNLKG